MNLELKIRPFGLPNFLSVDGPFVRDTSAVPRVDVGHLTKEQAEAYWEEMRTAWLAHWTQRKASLEKPAPRL